MKLQEGIHTGCESQESDIGDIMKKYSSEVSNTISIGATMAILGLDSD